MRGAVWLLPRERANDAHRAILHARVGRGRIGSKGGIIPGGGVGQFLGSHCPLELQNSVSPHPHTVSGPFGLPQFLSQSSCRLLHSPYKVTVPHTLCCSQQLQVASAKLTTAESKKTDNIKHLFLWRNTNINHYIICSTIEVRKVSLRDFRNDKNPDIKFNER